MRIRDSISVQKLIMGISENSVDGKTDDGTNI